MVVDVADTAWRGLLVEAEHEGLLAHSPVGRLECVVHIGDHLVHKGLAHGSITFVVKQFSLFLKRSVTPPIR